MKPLAMTASALLLALAGCAASDKPPADPSTLARDRDKSLGDRESAVDALWARRDQGREQAREELKRIAWTAGQPAALRIRAIDHLAGDTADESNADTRAMLRLLLPTESNAAVRDHVCGLAAERGWTEMTPAIVRSWAKPDITKPDAKRPERAALEALHPGRPVEEVVWEVFSTPVAAGLPPQEADRQGKARTAAWELLARIDPDGAARQRLLAGAAPSGADPTLSTAALVSSELRCVPVTAEQLRWAERLREFDNPQDGPRRRAWWEQTRAAVAGLNAASTGQLMLRHMEPIRWASRYQPDWLGMSREQLLGLLRERLAGREVIRRTAEGAENTPKFSESLADNRERLSWGDLLTILVIDEAIRAPGVAPAWGEQIQRDHRDSSTEYGGVLESDDAATDVQGVGRPARVFRAVLYPPRPTQRFGDERFVASDDMLSHGGWGLAHYHFHAKELNNRTYAGPGMGDMEYAGAQGRACLVITPLGDGRVNVDYYQSTGGVEARVDLGTLQVGTPG
jgi:hypothetical protein